MSDDNNNKQQMNPIVRYALIGILGVVAIFVVREIYNVINPPFAREIDQNTQKLRELYCKQGDKKYCK